MKMLGYTLVKDEELHRLKEIEHDAKGLIKEMSHPIPDGNMFRIYQGSLEMRFYGAPITDSWRPKSKTELQWKEISDILPQTPEMWQQLTGIQILDPDGWRFKTGKYPAQDFSIPIDYEEWNARMMISTIYYVPPEKKK